MYFYMHMCVCMQCVYPRSLSAKSYKMVGEVVRIEVLLVSDVKTPVMLLARSDRGRFDPDHNRDIRR